VRDVNAGGTQAILKFFWPSKSPAKALYDAPPIEERTSPMRTMAQIVPPVRSPVPVHIQHDRCPITFFRACSIAFGSSREMSPDFGK
jgi:hypothetical protein